MRCMETSLPWRYMWTYSADRIIKNEKYHKISKRQHHILAFYCSRRVGNSAGLYEANAILQMDQGASTSELYPCGNDKHEQDRRMLYKK